ncbi:MAG: 4a-hydroxytetrahydrobiopterin dehydratase [Armatimonadetes bacterium]|nr:4a-hydroxytetrahydrobiopterin dehydratase [Armatimonadota bacterium]
MTRNKLSETELTSALVGLPGWLYADGQIIKTYTFDSYAHGMMFAVAVGHFADQMDHHPDLLVTYQKVRVSLSTHDADGITEFDLSLAKKADLLAMA